MSTALKPASSHDVRSKFFLSLGIEKKLPPKATSPTEAASGNSNNNTSEADWCHPRQQNLNYHEEALKYDRDFDRNASPKRRKTTTRLQFSDTVNVIPIPMRTEYSNRVRSRLWSNAVEIHENAARNTIEFASEGWDWRSAVEDDQMYVCVATNELVHPVHYGDLQPQLPP